jgi:hypothetical protein
MLTTPHAVAGIAIGSIIGNPLVVIPLAIDSHFVLDMAPHWQETLAPYVPNKKTWIRVPIDLLIAIGLTLLAIHWHGDRATLICIGAIFANVPDLDTIVILMPRLKRGIISSFWDWHCKIQRETNSFFGLVPQIVVIVLGLLVANKA